VEVEVLTPIEFSPSQNYSNPFNPSATICYSIINPGLVKIKVYDIFGGEVSILVNKFKQARSFEVQFNSAGLASGMYLYRIETGSFVESRKMILLK